MKLIVAFLVVSSAAFASSSLTCYSGLPPSDPLIPCEQTPISFGFGAEPGHPVTLPSMDLFINGNSISGEAAWEVGY